MKRLTSKGFVLALLLLVAPAVASAALPKYLEFAHHSLFGTWGATLSTTSAADSLAIPVTHPYVIKTTGADAEALTLANGLPGQVIVVNLTTDGGGDGTLTPATATGWATIVFADAGDQATLFYVDDTMGWIILGLKGVSAPPVTTV
jgi:hypothetical protein